MTRRAKPFALDKDGTQIYVRVDHVMCLLSALIDGLPLTFFGRGKRQGAPYLTVDQAIEWVEKENGLNQAYRQKYGIKILDVLRTAKTNFLAGTFDMA